MLYDITLAIAYRYQSPAAASRNLLRMMPRAAEGQRLISGEVSVDPVPEFRRDSLDFFGNPVTTVAHETSHSTLACQFKGRVERSGRPPELDLSPVDLTEDLAAIASIAPDAPHHFLGASERISDVPEITRFARDASAGQGSVFEMVRAVNTALHQEMAFDPMATDVATPPAEAFAARRGVCQDFSQVMIAALRGLGLPAGYVSGFLRTIPPEGQPRLAGADAMHAWVRAWCGAEMGWVEIDPTNDLLVGSDHVTVAYGRDYADVAPIRGALRSAGAHGTSHQVDMVPVAPS